MRNTAILASLTILLAALAACDRPAAEGASNRAAAGADAALAAEFVLPEAPTVGPAEVAVRVTESDAAVEGAEVEILGTMTHAGMVPVERVATETEPGTYVADDFEFTMAGDWILTADVTLPDGRTAREEATVTVAQP